jgi:hypothetical protein
LARRGCLSGSRSCRCGNTSRGCSRGGISIWR